MLVLILAPTHQQYLVYAHKDRRQTRYIGNEKAFRGMSRDVPFVVVGSFDPRVRELRQYMLDCGYKELD